MPSAPAPAAACGGKYLTFLLGGEEYGVAVLQVREIIQLQPVTRVPRTPAFVRGVVNLRGGVVPVLDLRERFGLPGSDAAVAALSEPQRAAAEAARCIVVVLTAGPTGRPVPVGLVVDRVHEVAVVGADAVAEPPDFGPGARTAYLLGVSGAPGGGVRLLLDVDRVLAPGELAELVP